MLVILPLLVFATVFMDLVAVKEEHNPDFTDLRGVFLQAILFWGGLVAIISEGLSLFGALSQLWVTTSWGIVLLFSLWIGWRKGLLIRGWARLRQGWGMMRWHNWLVIAGLGMIFLALLVVALISPPNNTNSLQYHMSRVVHWAQNHSLQHYPTGFEPQLWNPIGAEVVILNLRLLWGNDRLANLVQWFSMLGSLVGISALAGLLGARRWGQFAAVAFAASIPMGILQATSTQNDYVTALWLVCLAYFVVSGTKRQLAPTESISLALAVGVGMLTKGTFYPYAVPFLLWYFITWLIRRRLSLVLVHGLLITGIVLVLNLGYWVRNTMTYDGPLGPAEWVQNRTARNYGPAPLLAALSKNTLLNFATPNEALNARMVGWLKSGLKLIGQNPNGFQLIWSWNHEDLAGNPLHVLLLPATLILLFVAHRRVQDRSLLWYTLASLASYAIFSLVVTFDQYGIRYQLPFWVSWAPVFGVVLSLTSEQRLAPLAVALLLMATLPWVFFNRSRPLIAMRQHPEKFGIPCVFGCTQIGSILNEPPSSVLFSNWTSLRDPYLSMGEALQSLGCTDIGLRIDSHDLEYLYWWLLNAPQSGIRIETIYFSPRLEKYVDKIFKPCAIICTICGDRTRLHGLNLTGTYGNAKLFEGKGYSPNEDD